MIDRRKFLQLPLLGAPFLFARDIVGQGFERLSTLKVTGPVVVSTWDSGLTANAGGWPILQKGGRALDAVEAAGRASEAEPSCCVGLAALPDRDGRVTLDASIMDERSNIGAVSFLERIKHPVSVARKVMETTPHVLLSGEGAQQFALANGFSLEPEGLSPESEKEWKEWLKKSDYKPQVNIENAKPGGSVSQFSPYFFEDGTPNHDTMATIAMDAKNDLSAMVTTSGLAYKMRGRVGDSPIIGAGMFVDNEIGAAVSTGVGEEVIRICGTHTVIEQMRIGRTPEQACREAIRRIVKRNPAKAKEIQVGFLALSRKGVIGACSIQKGFTFAVTSTDIKGKIYEAHSYFGAR